ncbi:hypothetical protein [Fervidibacter sacchari]
MPFGLAFAILSNVVTVHDASLKGARNMGEQVLKLTSLSPKGG